AEPVADQVSSGLAARAVTGATSLQLIEGGTLGDIAADDELLLVDDVRSEYVSAAGAVTSTGIQLNVAARSAAAVGDAIATQTVTPGTVLAVSDDMVAGGGLQLEADSITGLNAGDIIEITDTVDP